MNRSHQHQRTSRSRLGLSLIEVSVSTLIVGLVLVTALKCVGGVFQTSNTAASRYQGAHLADQLLSETLQCHYEEPDDAVMFGVEGVEDIASRTQWDDVDDFHTWSSSPPTDRNGVAIPNTSNWTRSVAVRFVEVDDPTVTALSDTGLKEITVLLVNSNGETVTRKALRSKAGMLEHTSLVGTTWVTSVDVEISTGLGTASTGVSLSNAPEDN
jgi:Tfp pilus assembly protein PilV